MREERRKQVFFRLRVVATLCALLLGWLSPVSPLLADDPDVCQMECCVAEGHCCCATRKPFVEGQLPNQNGQPILSDKALNAACPPQCAQPASGFQKLQVAKPLVVKSAGEAEVARLIYARTPHCARDTLTDESSAPRAPPLPLL